MKNVGKAGISALLLCGLLTSPATMHANVTTYTYTGGNLGSDPPYVVDPSFTRVTGYFTVGAALGASLPLTDITGSITAFSFSDGAQTLNSGNSTANVFDVSTGPTGAIGGWEIIINANDSSGYFFSCDNANTAVCLGPGWGAGEGEEVGFSGYLGLVEPNTGIWTPEPSLYGLLALGLTGLTWRARRSRTAG